MPMSVRNIQSDGYVLEWLIYAVITKNIYMNLHGGISSHFIDPLETD